MDRYYYSGGIPEDNSTYVERKADNELYEGLKAGKFCYVLNSSQSGKSSLRIRTISRLREDGIECASIDLSSYAKNISEDEWYKSLAETLIDYFFDRDVKFDEWWKQNQSYSGGRRFHKFLEEILLTQINENIVIFIDEIGSILSLDLVETDDFFVFIRYCHERRNDDRKYKRLTFCLLGIASPSDLIQDKNITAFNIGKGIFLKPFQLTDEIEPLIKGLREIYSDPEGVFKQILDWTGGQPFLTQKLCDLMVKESQTENPRTVEQVVRDRIIENWDFPEQDEPQHLRTIRDRITHKNASALLGLCQQIWETKNCEIIADNTPEQYQLQLSGLVVKEKNKLKVYNPIYKEIFNKDWIEAQLWESCPYIENLNTWVASNYKDNSRLLRGAMLQEAQEWLKDKSLSPQHERFLSSSQNQEEQEKLAIAKIEYELERERQDREAAEQRNQVLTEANNTLNEAKKISKRQIRVGSIILGLTLLSSIILGNWTFISNRTVQQQGESISRIKEIFYTDLENQLKNQEWEAADKLTSKIIWEIANTWQEPSFRAEDSRNFPCQDLRAMDELWTKYSDRRFGFSVQNSIWRGVNKDIIKFMSLVGWTRFETHADGKVTPVFVPVTDFSLNAPKGQLPWSVTWYGSDGTRDRTAYLNRISECLSENK